MEEVTFPSPKITTSCIAIGKIGKVIIPLRAINTKSKIELWYYIAKYMQMFKQNNAEV